MSPPRNDRRERRQRRQKLQDQRAIEAAVDLLEEMSPIIRTMPEFVLSAPVVRVELRRATQAELAALLGGDGCGCPDCLGVVVLQDHGGALAS